MVFIFDMGGVVTNTAEKDIFEKTAKFLGISVERLFEISGKDSGDDLFEKLDNGLITSKEYWKIFSERSGINVKCDYWRMMFHPVRNDAVCGIITELRKKHRVICGTNTIDSHYDNHLSRGDYAVFDQTYASIHLGVSKPDIRFWELILAAENVKPENAFFTDDKPENCKAAASIGMKTHLFESADCLYRAVQPWL